MLSAEITFDQTQDILIMLGALLAVVGGFYRYAWLPFVRGDEERAQRIADRAANQAVAPLADTLATIKGEVTTNGGKSLKDVVLDTRTKQAELAARFDQHIKENPHG